MPNPDDFDLSHEALRRHALDPRQFAGADEATLPDGMRLVRLYNASGLVVDLLPDRALDIWRASYRGLPLTWVAPGSPKRADAAASWLQLFNGGLLTTCGLRHAGPGEVDDETGERTDLHGEATRLAAHDVRRAEGWHDGSFELRVTGTVSESRLFGEQLRLERSYRMSLDAPELVLTDTVINAGDTPQPLMVLYHVNVGYPLVRDGAELQVASPEDPVPRDAAARPGAERWARYDAPTPAYDEQVFFHRPRLDPDGNSRALIGHPGLALELTWDARSAPYLTQWKNTREGIYVCGVEPGNTLPEGRNRARAAGRLEHLEPGERRDFRLRLSAVAGEESFRRAQDRVRRTAESGREQALDLSGYPD